MGARLFVGNLTFTASEDDLRNLFGPSGTIVDAKIVTDRETGRSRGFGFVEMSSAAEANAPLVGETFGSGEDKHPRQAFCVQQVAGGQSRGGRFDLQRVERALSGRTVL